MKLTNTFALLVPALLLLSGCSMLPGKNKVDDDQLIPETQLIVPEIQSTFLDGDTLWDFAERTTGSGFNWEQIKSFNKIEDEKKIDAGIVLLVPRDLAIESLKNQ